MASNTGYNFLGTVISAGILGFIIDKFAGTQPWGFIGFMVIGLCYAVFLAQREMNPPQENPNPDEASEKEDEKL